MVPPPPQMKQIANSQATALIPQKGISTQSSASHPKDHGHPALGGGNPSLGVPSHLQHPPRTPAPAPRGRGGEGDTDPALVHCASGFPVVLGEQKPSGAVGLKKGAFPLMNVISIPVNIHKITPALICIK